MILALVLGIVATVRRMASSRLGYYLIANALERARSTDPQKVRDALAKTDLKPPHPGAIMPGGCIKFDSTGWNTCVHPVMVQWQDGELRTVWPPSVATVKARLPW